MYTVLRRGRPWWVYGFRETRDALRTVPDPALPPLVEPPFRVAADRPISVWFTAPWGFVTHLSEPHRMDVASVRFIVAAWSDGAAAFGVTRKTRLRFVHSWAGLTGYDTVARRNMVEWGLAVRRYVESIDIVLSPDAGSLLRMGASVVETSFAVVGTKIRTHFGLDDSGPVRCRLCARVHSKACVESRLRASKLCTLFRQFFGWDRRRVCWSRFCTTCSSTPTTR